jgi:hypothetical protein
VPAGALRTGIRPCWNGPPHPRRRRRLLGVGCQPGGTALVGDGIVGVGAAVAASRRRWCCGRPFFLLGSASSGLGGVGSSIAIRGSSGRRGGGGGGSSSSRICGSGISSIS